MSFHATLPPEAFIIIFIVIMAALFTGGAARRNSSSSSSSNNSSSSSSSPESEPGPTETDTGGNSTPTTDGGIPSPEARTDGGNVDIGDVELKLPDSVEESFEIMAQNVNGSSASQEQQAVIENEINSLATVLGGMQNIIRRLESEGADTGELERQLQLIQQRLGQLSSTTQNVDLDVDNANDLEVSLENVLVNSVVQELEEIRQVIQDVDSRQLNFQQTMQEVRLMMQAVEQDSSPAGGEVLQVLQRMEQTLNQISQQNRQINHVLNDISQTQQQIVDVSQGDDSPAVQQFEMLLQEFQQVINQMNVRNENEVDFGDIEIDIEETGGAISGGTLIEIVELVQEDVSIQMLVQKLEMHQQVTNQLLVQILQELRTGEDEGETREFQQVLSMLEQHDVEYLAEAEQKELEQITKDAKQVLEGEKQEMRVLNTVAGRYSRMTTMISKLMEGLEHVVDEDLHRTDDGHLRSLSVEGSSWGASQHSDSRHGYEGQATDIEDKIAAEGAGLSQVFQDAKAIEEDLESFMDVETDVSENLRQEVSLLKDEIQRFKQAFKVYRVLETSYQDYDGSKAEFLASVSGQAVDRGIYDMDRNDLAVELKNIWDIGAHLEKHLKECQNIIQNEMSVGVDIIERAEELYGDLDELNQVWDEEYVKLLQDNIEDFMVWFQNQDELRPGDEGPRRTLVERSLEIVRINEKAEQELQQIVERKRSEEEVLQELEQEIEQINF